MVVTISHSVFSSFMKGFGIIYLFQHKKNLSYGTASSTGMLFKGCSFFIRNSA
jgi:hypothetical protein